MLTSHAIDAGTYPIQREWRQSDSILNRNYEVEKGGYIVLEWQQKGGERERRTIQVTRARALQAMSALANHGGRGIV